MFWQATLGIIIAIVIYNLIHHLFVVNPTKKHQLESEKHCRQILVDVISQFPPNNYDFQIIDSKVLSEVWGRGVQVFEFKLAVDSLDVNDKLLFLKQQLKLSLSKRNMDHEVKDADLLVTDLWQYDGFVHIEVAYLINQSTKEYVNDINRLTE